VELRDGQVTFRYKDYADEHRPKTMTLDAVEFLRRFVQHVLPRGFMKIRHYGLLANAQRQARLAWCRRLLLVATVAATVARTDTVPIEPAPSRCCARCGGQRLLYAAMEPVAPGGDTTGTAAG
jgi:Putative transposase.